jgi:hypothetical protein
MTHPQKTRMRHFLSSKEEEESLYSVIKSRRSRRDSVIEDTNETLGQQAMPVEKIRLDRHVAWQRLGLAIFVHQYDIRDI